MARFLCLALALGLSGSAVAQSLDAIPPPVKQEMELGHMSCIEGKTIRIGPNGLHKLDLSGEGRADYVIDDSDITCSGTHDLCGTGGCTLTIFMRTPSGYAKVWDEVAIAAKLVRRGRGYAFVLRLKKPGGYPLTTTRLAFAKGCAIDLTHGGKRLCGTK
jgi:hypothetical protein